MRLDKYLSDLNFGTRKTLKDHIKNGSVMVNKEICKNPAVQVNINSDQISFQGKLVTYQKYKYYMLNKPKDMVTASKDKYSSCVLDLFQQESVKNLFAVGRLDKDTEGLLLLTNDGVFSHKITSPSHNLWKTYYAILNDYIDSSAITAFEHGVSIGDLKITKPSKLTILESSKNRSFVTLSISEGRYHQVKRMFQTLGLKVTYLKRISIGSLQLDDSLPLGAYRELTKSEIDAIFI